MKTQSARGKPSREKRRRSLINLIGGLLLVAAGALIALLFFMNTPWLQAWYEAYYQRLYQFKDYVIDLPNAKIASVVIPLIVLLLYAIKSMIPIPPIPVLCLITAVLPMTVSFTVNFAGILLLVSIKYWWGRRLGGGQVQRLLKLQPTIRAFLEKDSKSKPWLLFVFRLVPSLPVNPVSQIYGAMGFDYADYALISLLGFLPRLVSYIIFGHYVFNPQESLSFIIVPLIIIFTLSGISVLGINMALTKRQKEG